VVERIAFKRCLSWLAHAYLQKHSSVRSDYAEPAQELRGLMNLQV
jgi:hypothetical protein